MGKFGEIIGWLFVFIVGSLIVTFLVSPGSFDSFKDNIKSITGKVTSNVGNNLNTEKLDEPQDAQIIECLAKFNECKRISETKTDTSIRINEYEKFTNYNEAMNFYKTWSPSQMNLMLGIGMDDFYLPHDNFPIVLISASVRGGYYDENQVSYVAVCDSNYNLVGQTKTFFNC